MSEHDQPVAPNLLDRRFDGRVPNQRWVGDTTELFVGDGGSCILAAILDLYSRFVVGWALSAVNDRDLASEHWTCAFEASVPRRRPASSLRPGQPVRQRGLPRSSAPRHHVQHEPARQLLRQRRDGELVLDTQDRARRAFRDSSRGEGKALRLHRGLLQPATPPLVAGLRQSGRVRKGFASTSGNCVVNLSTGSDQAHPQPGQRTGRRDNRAEPEEQPHICVPRPFGFLLVVSMTFAEEEEWRLVTMNLTGARIEDFGEPLQHGYRACEGRIAPYLVSAYGAELPISEIVVGFGVDLAAAEGALGFLFREEKMDPTPKILQSAVPVR